VALDTSAGENVAFAPIARVLGERIYLPPAASALSRARLSRAGFGSQEEETAWPRSTTSR
jgi:hypothetical protein